VPPKCVPVLLAQFLLTMVEIRNWYCAQRGWFLEDLKKRTVQGGLAKICGQVANLALRFGYIAVMARLLEPKDFGLFAMVLVVTGIFDLFSTAGLTAVTVQRETISNEQISTLFWVNVLVGSVLALLCLASAPVLAALYSETQLFGIAIALSGGFLATGAGVQHIALLQRELRYIMVAAIEVGAQLIAYGVGIAMAFKGFGYWSLVGAAVAMPCSSTIFSWLAAGWVPGRPHRSTEIASMLRFGGTLTLNGAVVYFAYNFDKFLLGRFWGADALGLYGRAYQLVNIPTQALNAAVGTVAFSALSRLQNDSARLKRYFLKSYTLVVSLTLPTTLFGALFAEDIIRVLLGPKWADAATIFRYLTPTILVFGIINPTYSFLISIGKQVRSLQIAFVIAPLVMISYLIGLPYGPNGVALAFSAAMSLWVIPHVIWCLHETTISPHELLFSFIPPFAAGLLSAAIALAFMAGIGDISPVFLRLLVEGGIMSIAYLSILMFVFGQRQFYLELLKPLFPSRDRRIPPQERAVRH
jgi:O-antigen/teichoic acid export membrane protein